MTQAGSTRHDAPDDPSLDRSWDRIDTLSIPATIMMTLFSLFVSGAFMLVGLLFRAWGEDPEPVVGFASSLLVASVLIAVGGIWAVIRQKRAITRRARKELIWVAAALTFVSALSFPLATRVSWWMAWVVVQTVVQAALTWFAFRSTPTP